MKVDVYRNLHKDCWSIRHQGKVIAHTDTVVLTFVKFVVQPAGRIRTIKERRKNVHAFVRGLWEPQLVFPLLNQQFKEVKYNPYINSTFVDLDGNSIYEAKTAVLCNRKCFVII